MADFLPAGVLAPAVLQTNEFRARKLTVSDLVKDYDAVMSSVEHLQGVFGPGEEWPRGLTLEEDLVDLGWHQKEFELGRSFAYTVMNPDESQCLGCLYVYPAGKQGYDAEVILWVRASEAETGLDDRLYQSVKAWMSEEWPFSSIAFPGREISWEAWLALPAV